MAFYLNATARIWPGLSYMCHIRCLALTVLYVPYSLDSGEPKTLPGGRVRQSAGDGGRGTAGRRG